MTIRAVLLKLHLWVALTVGLFLIIVSVTGAALVYEDRIDRATIPALATVTPAGSPLPMQEIVDRVRGTGKQVLNFSTGADATQSYQLMTIVDKAPAWIYVDQYTGQVLG